MKLLFLLGILSLVGFSNGAEQGSDSSEESSEEDDVIFGRDFHGHGHHHGHEFKCRGLEDVDLSDLNLDVTDFRKLLQKLKTSGKNDGEKFPFIVGEVRLADIKTAVTENAMGVVRKVVVMPDKKRIFAKVMKTSQASGDFSTSISGSLNTSVDTSTTGTAKFGVDLETFTTAAAPHNTFNGESTVVSNSSTAWVKKLKLNILQTKSSAASSSSVSWSDATSSVDTAGSLTSNVSATSTSGTVSISKKCFGTSVGTNFNVAAAGAGWNTTMVGKGKGGVFTHVLFATKNGTAVTWSFAKVTIKTQLTVHAGNITLDGSQYVTVKSFTETITRPADPETAKNADKVLEVSNEIKLRVGAKTTLSNGIKMYATGGQILFRNSKVNIPAASAHNSDEVEDDEEAAHVLVGNVIRKQVQAEDLMVNPVFVHSVLAYGLN